MDGLLGQGVCGSSARVAGERGEETLKGMKPPSTHISANGYFRLVSQYSSVRGHDTNKH